MRRPAFALALAFLLLALPAAPAQTIFYINGPLASSANTGASWPDAFRGPDALQRALDAAHPLAAAGQTVQLWVARGTYTPTARTVPNIPATATFALQSHEQVYGGFVGYETTLGQRNPAANVTTLSGLISSGQGAWHVVTTSGVESSCTLDGFTVRDGFTNYDFPRGAGILNIGGSPRVRNCTIRDNALYIPTTDPRGGGVYTENGAPRFEDCLFLANRGGQGAALCGDATLIRCVFDSNHASGLYGNGGAIAGACVIRQCVFRSNWASFGGGAIYGSALIEDSTFEGNADDGGAALVGGPFTVSRSSFLGNNAAASTLADAAFSDCEFIGQYGSNYNVTVEANELSLSRCRFTANRNGYLLGASTVTATNCVFSNNYGGSITTAGGLLVNCTYFNNSSLDHPMIGGHGTSPLRVTNCIFWNNRWQSGLPPFSGNIVVNRSCLDVPGIDVPGAGNFSADPRLDPEGRLLFHSPCIDAGDSSALPPGTVTDFFGQPRFRDDPSMPNTGPAGPLPPVDIGAAEFQGTTCYANCDASTAPPILNAADFSCFIQAFASGSPYSNCDASTWPPVLNISDFICFQQKFAAGCP